MSSSWRRRFERLTEALRETRSYWHPSPYRGEFPGWCASRPDLLGWAAGAPADLAVDPVADAPWRQALIRQLPVMADIFALTDLPRHQVVRPPAVDGHLAWAIPGRKVAQIKAFVAVMGAPVADVVDWCGGKGHLGRVIAAHYGRDVDTLDVAPALIAAGHSLARRARVAVQRHDQCDLAAASEARISGRHLVALHACGELHRQAVRQAIAQQARGIDLVPCCYAKGVLDAYAPLTARVELPLDVDDLRLAATGEATSGAAERLRRYRESVWKMGFRALLPGCDGDGYRPLSRIPSAWLNQSFEDFCRRLAAREGLSLAATSIDWGRAEAAGVRRLETVETVNRLRLAFARPLEVWLLLDLAVCLEDAGYQVRAGTFCDPRATPRNLMLSARA